MVSVSNITNNVNQNAINLVQRKVTPSFSGGVNPVEVEKAAIATVEKGYSKFIKGLINLDKMRGEAVNAWFTGVGTAIIAPIFIAMNPFSKEDKDTKIYSAWRQPISAVIALMMQLAVTRKFEHYMDCRASTGQDEIAKYMKARPADSYVTRLLKLQHPEYTADQLKVESERFSIDAFKNEVCMARDKMKNTEIKPEQLVGRSDYEKAREVIEKQFKDKIKTMSKKDAEEFIKKESLEHASKSIMEKVTISAEKKFRIRQLVDSGTKSFEDATKIVTEQIAKLNLPEDLTTATPHQLRENRILKAMLDQFTTMKDYESRFNKSAFSSLINLGSTYEDILQNVKIKQYVSAMADNAKFALKQQKIWYGMGVTLLTLPFSCGLLNWAYPRIMEKIMPHAYAKKQGVPATSPQIKQGKEAKV